MALAYLTFEGNDGGYRRFKIDIGKNRFYSYAIGEKESQRVDGLKMLQNRKFTSPLIGPLPESALGRAMLEIPNHHFDKDNRYVQLMSFRTKFREGPAISNIIVVQKSLADISELPELTFSRSDTVENPVVENVPFRYKESKMSSAMFLNVLTSLIPKVLPHLSGLIGGLLGGGKKGKESPASSLLQTASNPETVRLITELLKQISVSKSQSMSHSPEYSEAKIAPALLAALPSLMPLLKKVMDPETIKAILGSVSPTKVIGAVTDSVEKLGKLGIASHEQDLKHLRALNPGVDDPALDRLLQGMSINLSQERQLVYRRVDSVKLQFINIAPTMIYGRSRIAYLAGRDLVFPLRVDTPRPTGKAILTITIKEPTTLEIVAKQKFPLENVMSGILPIRPRLSATRLSSLNLNEDYLVCATLIWKNKSGKKIGASMTQLITLVGEYSFDRVEESTELTPLNNVHRHRPFWHKSWQGSFTPELRRITFDCKYYFVLEGDRKNNGRMETLTRIEDSGFHKETRRLKSGMILSPYVLNQLIPQISAHPLLDDAQLKAIQSPDFIERFNQAARVQVKLKGSPGDSVALWNYPEVKLQQIILKKVKVTNESGHVTDFVEHPAYFPMPALVHFIGARTR